MDEIKVGEYVRTKKGKIFQYGKGRAYLGKDNAIIKHSKILSEVVQVGDYVNGKLIHKIDKGQNYCYLYYGNCKTFVDYQIKTTRYSQIKTTANLSICKIK